MSVGQCPGETYTIQPGDTFWRIAQARNLSLDALLRANPGINPDRLAAGQIICLPTPAPPYTRKCAEGQIAYTIQPGDTIWAIAERAGTFVSRLLFFNPGTDPNNLQVGETICIPAYTAPAPPPSRCAAGLFPYAVQPGDTLWALAQRRGTTVEQILRFNPGVDPENLRVGQFLCLP